MHADLSRLTFRPERHYSAVLAQQGRVQLDADANEQTAIELAARRALTADLIGQHGGPAGATGFRITFQGGQRDLDDLTIGGGRYYVDGIPLDANRPRPGVPVPDDDTDHDDAPASPDTAAEAASPWTYWDQPDAHLDRERAGDRLPTQFPFVVYLKVWERAVTAAEDPALREVALGAALPDTAARVKVVWQVRPLPLSELTELSGPSGPSAADGQPSPDEVRRAFRAWADRQEAPGARIALRAERPERADEDPCLVAPDARYRGPENQLYRVEIHDGGSAREATFKWSRENGSVVFPVDDLDGTWVQLATLGGDGKLDLDVGDRVEFVDSAYASRLEALPLLRVEELDLPGRRVRLSGEPAQGVGRRPELNPYLRRWDHRDGHRRTSGSTRAGAGARLQHGAVRIEEGRWLPLEDGVEVYFAPGGHYRTGDFWCAAARTATGAVEWPADAARRPLLQPPLGVALHHAPLALITGEQGSVDLRLAFGPLAGPIPAASAEQLAAEREARQEEIAAEARSGQNPRSETTAGAEAAAAPDADGGPAGGPDGSTDPAGQRGTDPGAGGGRGGRRHG